MMQLHNQLLVDRVNRKERRAFHELFKEYYSPLVGYALKYVQRQEEAEDLVQDIFIALWESDTLFKNEIVLRAYLYQSLKNRSLNHIKHQRVKRQYVEVKKTEEQSLEPLNFDMMEEEVYRLLLKAVKSLPPRCREVFELHLEGLKNREIATQLKISELTVKSQKSKAVQILRKHFSSILFFLLKIRTT